MHAYINCYTSTKDCVLVLWLGSAVHVASRGHIRGWEGDVGACYYFCHSRFTLSSSDYLSSRVLSIQSLLSICLGDDTK